MLSCPHTYTPTLFTYPDGFSHTGFEGRSVTGVNMLLAEGVMEGGEGGVIRPPKGQSFHQQ